MDPAPSKDKPIQADLEEGGRMSKRLAEGPVEGDARRISADLQEAFESGATPSEPDEVRAPAPASGNPLSEPERRPNDRRTRSP